MYSWLHKFELDYQVLVVLVPGPPDDLKCHKGKVLTLLAASRTSILQVFLCNERREIAN